MASRFATLRGHFGALTHGRILVTYGSRMGMLFLRQWCHDGVADTRSSHVNTSFPESA